MLLHVVPRMFACRVTEPQCDLIDFQCPELGLELRNDVDLVARRPYPNKNYLVACRKVGRKAMNGFMIETNDPVSELTTITRWAVGAERVVSHEVQYIVLDSELDAFSEDMTLWYATGESLGGWRHRWPEVAKNWTPATSQPRMELAQRVREGHFTDTVDLEGQIAHRAEVFQLHTIERERFEQFGRYRSTRIPPASSAFVAAI